MDRIKEKWMVVTSHTALDTSTEITMIVSSARITANPLTHILGMRPLQTTHFVPAFCTPRIVGILSGDAIRTQSRCTKVVFHAIVESSSY